MYFIKIGAASFLSLTLLLSPAFAKSVEVGECEAFARKTADLLMDNNHEIRSRDHETSFKLISFDPEKNIWNYEVMRGDRRAGPEERFYPYTPVYHLKIYFSFFAPGAGNCVLREFSQSSSYKIRE